MRRVSTERGGGVGGNSFRSQQPDRSRHTPHPGLLPIEGRRKSDGYRHTPTLAGDGKDKSREFVCGKSVEQFFCARAVLVLQFGGFFLRFGSEFTMMRADLKFFRFCLEAIS